MLSNSFKEECGLMGVFSHKRAGEMIYLGLCAQQHRGQEACGIVAIDEDQMFSIQKGLGLVHQVLNQKVLHKFSSQTSAIGHVRYSTKGVNNLKNVQPLTAETSMGKIAVAHNGNIVNSSQIREKLIKKGIVFQGTNDTENFVHLLSQKKSLDESLLELEGAFCFLVLTSNSLIAIRDSYGFRPLVLGKLEDSYVVASETCAFDLMGAKTIREVEPGEIVEISYKGLSSRFFKKQKRKTQCVFEHVYFARPDSEVFGLSAYKVRKETGRILAKQAPVKDADFVMPVPDSGMAASLGFAEESGLKFEMAIIRNHYVGRTFIQPEQAIRNAGLKIKLNPQACIIRGKKVVVIDDSLVRGSTSSKIIGLIRQAGAKEVHLRIAAPPTIGPCFYGVDTPSKQQLIASHKSVDEIRKIIGADSLMYLSEEGLAQATKSSLQNPSYCMACFNGNYPTDLFGSLD